MLLLDRGGGPGSVWVGDRLVRGRLVEREVESARPAWREILDTVSQEHRISVRDILERGRFREIVIARQDAMWRMKRAGMTYASIGRRLNRDHATVMWGVAQHARRLASARATAARRE